MARISVDEIFEDAHRRVGIAEQRGEDPRQGWHALLTAAEARHVHNSGWFKPVMLRNYETELRHRIRYWWQLTDVGWKEYVRRYEGKPGYFEQEK